MFANPTSTEELRLCRLTELERAARAQALSRVREIFFATSSRTEFSSPEHKEKFFSNYTSYYVEFCPEWFYVAIKNNQVLGYLTGCPDSHLAEVHLEKAILTATLFKEWFQDYPAHLHINVDPSMQGQGLGGKLVTRFLEDLAQAQVKGVHLVTAALAENVKFYSKLGFTELGRKHFGHTDLVCLGQKL